MTVIVNLSAADKVENKHTNKNFEKNRENHVNIGQTKVYKMRTNVIIQTKKQGDAQLHLKLHLILHCKCFE